MEAAAGDAVVVIDCDLQDPPELIAEMVARWQEGYEVVYAQRRTRRARRWPSASSPRSATRDQAHRRRGDPGEHRRFPAHEPARRGDVVALREEHGFLRGLVALVGFKQTSVLYDRDPRAGGEGKYNRFLGSLVIGMNGIVGFSRYPLHLISMVGMILSGSRSRRAPTSRFKLVGFPFPTGNPTIVILISFFSGIQLLSLGVMAEYVGRIYDEVKRRPAFILESSHGVDDAASCCPGARGTVEPSGVDECARTRRDPVGGLGTRLGERVPARPKAAAQCARESRFLLHQCDCWPAAEREGS